MTANGRVRRPQQSATTKARTTEWRRRELAERLGVSASMLWNNQLSTQAVGRLDFQSGTEVLSLA